MFWLYLWQLKEYHTGRFLDHFRTEAGRKILFNPWQVSKVALTLLFLATGFFIYAYYVLVVAYTAEIFFLLKNIFSKSFKRPKWTQKTIFLFAIICAIIILFLPVISRADKQSQVLLIMALDILTSLIVSLIILIFQPFVVLLRNNTLTKAATKMKQIKTVSGLKVIAITGSYGKTSTKEFLTTILEKKYKALATKEHQNSEIGIAKAILNDLKPSHQFFIAEIGAYNKGKVKEVCSMIKPEIGVVTGVNPQHMALFGSMENLLSAEGGRELLEALPDTGMIFVNGENKYCLELIKKSNKLLPENEKVYALNKKDINTDIWADEVDILAERASFVAVNAKRELAHFDAKILGRHNVGNLLGAILIASELGMSFEEIAQACRKIKPEQAGIVLRHSKHGINIIDSSYSSNPDGVLADVEYLKIFPKKKLIVMPCLIELGKESKTVHEEIGKKIAEVCDLAIITSKERFLDIKKGSGDSDKIVFIKNPEEIFSKITTFCKSGDVVLLEGRVSAKLITLLV